MRVLQANVAAQLLLLAASPLLTRIYGPAEFGLLGLFNSILGLAQACSTWRFDWSVPNARSLSSATTVMVAGFMTLVATCLLALVGVLVADQFGLLNTGKNALGALAYLIPVAMLGGGAALMFQGWYVRINDLNWVSKTKVRQSLARIALSLGAGLVGLKASGLVVASVVAAWVGLVTLARHAGPFWERVRRVRRGRLEKVVLRMGWESTWSTLASVLNAATLSSTVVLVTACYSLREAGWYALMANLAAAPISLLSTAVGQSFWGAAADLARARKMDLLRRQYLRTVGRLGLLSIPVVLGCMAGPLVIGPIFGQAKWGGAGWVLFAMAPMLVGNLMFSPTNHLVVLNRQSVQLAGDSIRILLIVASITICASLRLGVTWAVAGASVSSFFGNALIFAMHLRIHRRYRQAAQP